MGAFLHAGERHIPASGISAAFTWAPAQVMGSVIHPIKGWGLCGGQSYLFSIMVHLASWAVEMTENTSILAFNPQLSLADSLSLFLEVAPNPFVEQCHVSLEHKVVYKRIEQQSKAWSQILHFPRQSWFPVLSQTLCKYILN